METKNFDLTEKDIHRFWGFVAVGGSEECWVYKGTKYPDGYGKFILNKSQNLRAAGAHRVVWTISKGEIPNGLCVLHKCDNPSCVNPRHLFLGTQRDNVYDMVSKNRNKAVHGEKQWNALLSDEDVINIKQLCRNGGISKAEIGRKYNVSRQVIYHIVKGLSWKHIP